MNEIKTSKERNIEVNDKVYAKVGAGFTIVPMITREKQHLIEEKMDTFFDEVEQILFSGSDHTV